jgi:hypothetical protein
LITVKNKKKDVFKKYMTSWLKAQSAQVKRRVVEPAVFFQPTRGGISSNLNGLIYSVLYTLKQGEILSVYDHPNCVSETFPIYEEVLKANPNIRYLKSAPSTKNLMASLRTTSPIVSGYRLSQIRQVAQDIFQLNDDASRAVQAILEARGVQQEGWDVGVHIRSGDKITTGEMKEIPITSYIDAVRNFQTRQNKRNLRVFVMTDNWAKWEEFKKRADPSWFIGSLIQKTSYTEKGHVQGSFEALPENIRLRLFFEFMAELTVMQRIPNMVVTFSSNVGRLLYLINRTNPTSDAVISLDVKAWSPF